MTSPATPTPDTPTQLIVGVDYDVTCRQAALHALSLARLFGVPTHLLHVSSSPYAGDALHSAALGATLAGTSAEEHNVLHAIQREEAQRMQQFAASFAQSSPITWSVESGEPKRVLLEYSQKYPGSWLVLGARRHTAIAEWFLGSTAAYVVRHCEVPALVVPPQSEPSKSAR